MSCSLKAVRPLLVKVHRARQSARDRTDIGVVTKANGVALLGFRRQRLGLRRQSMRRVQIERDPLREIDGLGAAAAQAVEEFAR